MEEALTKSISHELIEFAISLTLKDIPKEVIIKAKMHILDTLGIMLAAYNHDAVKPIVNIVKSLKGSPESTVIGYDLRVPAPNAALANATIAHSVDYDDTHIGSVIHPSSVIVPTALAVGEKMGSTGRDLLEAIIAGYEAVIRLGLVAPTVFHLRGLHPTGVMGVFGSALVSGKIMGLSVEQLKWAFGIAGSLASGIRQAQAEGILLKPIHPGFASHNGILAALLAKEGLKGPCQVFEGVQGLFNAYLKGEKIEVERATAGLGEKWETLNISIKPYPTCHATHSSIDLALIFRDRYGIKLEDIEEFRVYVPKLTVHLVVEPYQEKISPKTPYAAKFSLPYTVTVALRKGRVGLWDFTEDAIKDVEILKYAKKIVGVHDEVYDKYIEQDLWPARAEVTTKDGASYEEEVLAPKGTPRNPMTKDEVIAKFLDNVKLSKYNEVGKELVRIVFNLENYGIWDILELLKPQDM